MNQLKQHIIGALVGLARATVGNEDLITSTTLKVIFDAFISEPSEEILNTITDEKRKLTPNCFYCANPCGRTSDYIVLEQFNDYQITIINNLNEIVHKYSKANQSLEDSLLYDVIFTSLYYIGENHCNVDDLYQVINQQKTFLEKNRST